MSGGPGASALFPFGQEQQNHQPHWGVYPDANSLPNAPGNILVLGKFENLAVGHLAWGVSEGVTYQCVSVGTVGGGDATWRAIGFLAAGVATLGAAGAVTVVNGNVKVDTRFLLTVQDGGTLVSGIVQVTARTVGVDFTITSNAAASDAGALVYWQLWEDA